MEGGRVGQGVGGGADIASWHPRNAGCFGKLKFASGRAQIMVVAKAKLSLGPNEHRLLMPLQVTCASQN